MPVAVPFLDIQRIFVPEVRTFRAGDTGFRMTRSIALLRALEHRPRHSTRDRNPMTPQNASSYPTIRPSSASPCPSRPATHARLKLIVLTASFLLMPAFAALQTSGFSAHAQSIIMDPTGPCKGWGATSYLPGTNPPYAYTKNFPGTSGCNDFYMDGTGYDSAYGFFSYGNGFRGYAWNIYFTSTTTTLASTHNVGDGTNYSGYYGTNSWTS